MSRYERLRSLLAGGLLLAGCSSPPPPAPPAPPPGGDPFITPAQAGPYPANYRALVRAFVPSYFVDPASVRNMAVARPFPFEPTPGAPGWMVCAVANVRGEPGGNSELQRLGFMISNGAVVDALPHRVDATEPSQAQAQRLRNDLDRQLVLISCQRRQLDPLPLGSASRQRR